MPDTIHIAASCDDHYVSHVAALFRSIIANASSSSRFCFHLISTHIAPHHLTLLSDMIEGLNAKLNIIAADDSKFAHMPTLRYGLAAYQRIALADYLDDNIERVIYLDSDVIVVDDITPLWQIDMNGAPVAAVENLSPKACQDFGFARQQYFNSGVLLVDLAQWRARDMLGEASAFIQANQHRLRFIDQCTLNGLFSNQWLRLPLRWNQQADIYGVYKKYAQGCGYSLQEMAEAIKQPVVVHFIGKQKPWRADCFHPFQADYYYYLNQTPFASNPFGDASRLTRLKRLFSVRKHSKQYRRRRAIVSTSS